MKIYFVRLLSAEIDFIYADGTGKMTIDEIKGVILDGSYGRDLPGAMGLVEVIPLKPSQYIANAALIEIRAEVTTVKVR